MSASSDVCRNFKRRKNGASVPKRMRRSQNLSWRGAWASCLAPNRFPAASALLAVPRNLSSMVARAFDFAALGTFQSG